MLSFISLFAKMTLAGAYIGYWANVAAMYYAFYMEPTKSVSTFATTEDAVPYFGGYIGLSIFDAVVSIAFVRDIVAFYEKAKEADDFKQAIKEAASEAAAEDASFIAI